MNTNVKIFPSLVAVAVVALGVKVTSIVADYSIIGQAVEAQEKDQKKPQVPNEDGDKKPSVPTEKKAAPKKSEVDELDKLFKDDMESAEEEATLKLLTERRRELDKRERMLNLKEKMLEALDGDLKQKITKLEKIRAEIDEQLGKFGEAEQKKMDKLVAYYNRMDAKVAAQIFVELIKKEKDQEILLRVIKDMKDTKVSEILAKMPADQASKITLKLATIAKPNVDNVINK